MYREKMELNYGNGKIVFEEEPDIELLDPNQEKNLDKTMEIQTISKEELLENTSVDLFGDN